MPSVYSHKAVSSLIAGVLWFPSVAFAQEIWTLEASARRALDVSPHVQIADAEVAAKEGGLQTARAWPNPEFGLDANEKFGIEDGTGGTDLTQVSVSQPIPVGRFLNQSRLARADLRSARENAVYERLLQESETARSFHQLQFMSAVLVLAQERLDFAERYKKKDGGADEGGGKNGGSAPESKNAPLVRYLNPLEQKRLDIARADAGQQMANAEGEYSEALSHFKALLKLPLDEPSEISALEEINLPESLETLLYFQKENHPAILAAFQDLVAAKAEVGLAQGELLPSPSVAYYRERDSFEEGRQGFDGVTVNFDVPVWDWKTGAISTAKAHVRKAEYHLQAVRQELEVELRQTYMHLGHLIEQAERYRVEILAPAKELFELTGRGFDVGESNVLSFLDAYDVYFNARTRYQELLYEAAVEAAEMRLATGSSITGGAK